MFTPRRRHDHWRVNRKYSRRIGDWDKSWHNIRGMGKRYKKRVNRAERRFAKAQLRGRKGKEPSGHRSEINWRGD